MNKLTTAILILTIFPPTASAQLLSREPTPPPVEVVQLVCSMKGEDNYITPVWMPLEEGSWIDGSGCEVTAIVTGGETVRIQECKSLSARYEIKTNRMTGNTYMTISSKVASKATTEPVWQSETQEFHCRKQGKKF